MIKKIVFFALLLLYSAFGYAADIDLKITQSAVGDVLHVVVLNNSAGVVEITGIEIEFNDKVVAYKTAEGTRIHPGESLKHRFILPLPVLSGSLPLRLTVFYENEGKLFSLNTVGYYHHIEPRIYAGEISINVGRIQHEGKIKLVGNDVSQWHLVIPVELTVVSEESTSSEKTFYVRANRKGFVTSYPIYAITTRTENQRNFSKIISSVLTVDDRAGYVRGRLSNTLLLIFLGASLIVFAWVWSHQAQGYKLYMSALGKYSARIAWLLIGYLVLKNADTGCYMLGAFADELSFLRIDQQATYLPFSIAGKNLVADFFFVLSDNFDGANYKYFFLWFIDLYVFLIVVLSFVYLFHFKPAPSLAADKYAASLGRLMFPWMNAAKNGCQTNRVAARAGLTPARLGFLTLGVKLFYIPYLISWTIQNANHQWYLSKHLEFNFQSINSYLLSFFLLIDAAIFAFGYVIESQRLKSEIRSVEPTLLGWLVCLWCYPPFNNFSFSIFDYSFFPIHFQVSLWLEPFFNALITCAWGIFAWASISLGFKASNLTNRGTVSHGPYRFCRHPAYAAKMLLWTIEAVIFGHYYVGLVLGYFLIYFLRAWTEERHLSIDSDYLQYKKKVKYMFVPGIL